MWLDWRLFLVGIRLLDRERQDLVLENIVLHQQLAIHERSNALPRSTNVEAACYSRRVAHWCVDCEGSHHLPALRFEFRAPQPPDGRLPRMQPRPQRTSTRSLGRRDVPQRVAVIILGHPGLKPSPLSGSRRATASLTDFHTCPTGNTRDRLPQYCLEDPD